MPEGAKVSLIFFILFQKKRQTGQPMTYQTHTMEVLHQRPCSRFYAAHAIVFYNDCCLESVCFNSLTYPCLQVHCTKQFDQQSRLLFRRTKPIFGPTPSSLKLVPKELCMSIIIRHPIRRIFLCQSRYERCMPVKNNAKIMYILFIKKDQLQHQQGT